MINFKNLFTLSIAFLPFLSLAQDVCEPIFTVPKVMHVNSVGADGSQAGTEMIDASDGGSCLLYTSPSPRDVEESRMPSSA